MAPLAWLRGGKAVATTSYSTNEEGSVKTIAYESPVGILTLTSDGRAMTGLWFEGRGEKGDDTEQSRDRILDRACRELDRYFEGRLTEFTVPVDPQGTAFQRRVWGALRTIPYGVTKSYGDIARKIGSEAAVRAVGAANGANPVAIIIPCHRVIGANGSLTGFGGGLDRKRFLIDLERGVPALL
jgi:methylated-DNA-[protein]-cysteine S-methyltransferase